MIHEKGFTVSTGINWMNESKITFVRVVIVQTKIRYSSFNFGTKCFFSSNYIITHKKNQFIDKLDKEKLVPRLSFTKTWEDIWAIPGSMFSMIFVLSSLKKYVMAFLSLHLEWEFNNVARFSENQIPMIFKRLNRKYDTNPIFCIIKTVENDTFERNCVPNYASTNFFLFRVNSSRNKQ